MGKPYLLKISLQEAKPQIWRRFIVPADIALDTLHRVIQIVMGWSGGCFHLFLIGKRRYTYEIDVDPDFGDIPDEKFSLENVLPRSGKFKYLYDISGAWMHDITVENKDYTNPDCDQAIFCLEGKYACPPNDCCFGVGGYEYFCQAIADPNHEEHEDLVKCYDKYYGGTFDQEHFDIGEINQMLHKICVNLSLNKS